MENITLRVAANISFTDDQFRSEMIVKLDGHSGISFSQKFQNVEEEQVLTTLMESLDEGSIENFTRTDSLGVDRPILTFDWVKDLQDEDIIYLNPFPYGAIDEVPFKRDERFSPIDYKFKIGVTMLSKIELPSGYSVDLPKSTRIKMPDNAAVFTYSVSQLNEIVTIISRLKINKLDYTPDEYAGLKAFYEAMVENNNQLIVLKKT